MNDMNFSHNGWQKLGVPFEIATEDACKIEHILSKESYTAIKKFVKEHIS